MSSPLPDLPGGRYTAQQNADGTWNVLNVPIFAEHVVDVGDEKFKINKAWMVAAMRKAQRRFNQDQYLPPLHINHHDTGRETKLAGFYKIRSVSKQRYEGKPLWVMAADLVNVPDAVYQEIRAGLLPYRSVEIHDIDKPEVDSLALMPDEVPFFRLAMLTIGKEVEAREPVAINKRSVPVRAYHDTGKRAKQVLLHFPTEAVVTKYRDDDDELLDNGEDAEEIEIIVEDEGDEEVEEQMAAGDSLRAALQSASESLQSALSALGGLEDKEPDESLADDDGDDDDDAPKPVDMREDWSAKSQAVRSDYANSSQDLAKYMAKVDALEKKQATGSLLRKALKELKPYGMDDEGTAKKLRRLFRSGGTVAVQTYVDTVQEIAQREPAPWTGDVPTAAIRLDPAAQSFASFGAEATERAQRYAGEYDQLAKRMSLSYSKDQHVKECLLRDGFKVNGGTS